LIGKASQSWHFFGSRFLMFRNYFRTAWRSLLRNRVYSFLNITGLTLGMSVALLIGLWVYYQYSFDRWLPGNSQACQVRFNSVENGTVRTTGAVCIPLATALKNDIPGIACAAAAWGPGEAPMTVGDKNLEHCRVISGGADFLTIFQFPLLAGHAADALRDPDGVVLTGSTAIALFGRTDVVGRAVQLYHGWMAKVTAVMKDLPRNSSFQLDAITRFVPENQDAWVRVAATNWNDCFFSVFVRLKDGADAEKTEAAARLIVKKYAPASYAVFHRQVVFQPIRDWHLYSEYKDGVASHGLIDYVRMFSIIGALVLLIACINFMNLSTARSAKRAREVGVRKVIGSSRKGLIIQFLIESIVLTTIAFAFSLLVASLVLPGFDALTGSFIQIPFSNGWFWLIMLSYILLTGLLAGLKPAFYLSSFQPAKVLKGTIRSARSTSFSRKALVVLQFTCSIALIIGTIVIYQQIEHARNRPAGYDPNRLVVTEAAYTDYEPLKQAMLASGLVTAMTKSMSRPTDVNSRNTINNWEGKLPNEPLNIAMNAVADTDYFRTLDIPFSAGRNFTGNFGADSTCAILNETAVKRMRLKNPINQVISWSVSNGPTRLRVVGVVKDALTQSPFAAAEPILYVFQPGWTFNYTYRLAPGVNTRVALDRLGQVYAKYSHQTNFAYTFVDEDFAAGYRMEKLIGQLAAIFSGLAILISCLGLFGLAAYVAEQRTKEIGIRKVLGASVPQIFLLLTRDFLILVMVSCLVASPVVYALLENWLKGYYYRIHINPLVFVAAGAAGVVITALTVGFQAIKAALLNPVKGLRSE
jgi:putative ABC transport system permease protein